MKRLLSALACLALLAGAAAAQSQLQAPKSVTANTELTVSTSGSGDATLYLVGPASFSKRSVKLGEPIRIAPEELHAAGAWLMVVKSGSGTESASFDVLPAEPGKLSFVVRPSRLPVAVHSGISGVAYLLDNYNNLVTAPQDVAFRLSVEDGPTAQQNVKSKDGIAWTQLDSGSKAGAAHLVANVGDISAERVVQQVASAACNLHIAAKPGDAGKILVATDPVRDCTGNAVPDGTVVTFTSTANGAVTTVDAPIKKGVAQAELPARPGAVISAASGVIMGNELRWGAR
ncbi:MAG TPA: hypothetical protein VL382_05525 [Terriglobales bacterium]|nr:hypothetical protein [Terriglobales bacterium]